MANLLNADPSYDTRTMFVELCDRFARNARCKSYDTASLSKRSLDLFHTTARRLPEWRNRVARFSPFHNHQGPEGGIASGLKAKRGSCDNSLGLFVAKLRAPPPRVDKPWTNSITSSVEEHVVYTTYKIVRHTFNQRLPSRQLLSFGTSSTIYHRVQKCQREASRALRLPAPCASITSAMPLEDGGRTTTAKGKIMISNIERFVYNGVINVSTFRDNFPNDIPSADEIFSQLNSLHNAKKLSSTSYGKKEMSIADIDYKKGQYVAILFWITDPDILDNDYKNPSGTIHRAKRRPGHIPSASAHMVVSLEDKHDTEARYPCVIENVAWVSKTLILKHLQAISSEHLSVRKPAPIDENKKRTLIYQPMLEFGASSLNTLGATLDSGTALKGVKWQEIESTDGTVGSKAYATQKRKDVFVSVSDKPTAGVAKQIINSIRANIPKKSKKLSVIIEDTLGKTKHVSVAAHQSDILASFFIPQELIGPFTSPYLNMCEDKVRNDVINYMLKIANA